MGKVDKRKNNGGLPGMGRDLLAETEKAIAVGNMYEKSHIIEKLGGKKVIKSWFRELLEAKKKELGLN